MLWVVVSLLIAGVLSSLGQIISNDLFNDDASNMFVKVFFWLVVAVFLNAQLLHLIHIVHVRDGA